MNSHDRVPRVVLTRKQSLGLELVDYIAQRLNLALEFGVDVFSLKRQIEIGGNVIAAASQVGIGREHVLQALLLAHDLLRFLRIRP